MASLGGFALAPSSQFVEAKYNVDFFVLHNALGREGSDGSGKLLQDAWDSDAKHALSTGKKVDDFVVRAALINRGAVGDEGELSKMVNSAIPQGFHREADILQRNAGV